MPHELSRLLSVCAREPWLIDPAKAEEIVAVLEMRLARGTPFERQADVAPAPISVAASAVTPGAPGSARVLSLQGTILPRANMMSAMSGGVSLAEFGRAFRQAAEDPGVSAIVLDVDSPGGRVDMVQETARLIHASRREGRPIIAVANTLAASAAYWLASAADELVVTPSGMVGSIGVYMVHQDRSRAWTAAGVDHTVISEGPRKAEGVFGPLDDAARGALQAHVRAAYDTFTKDVAKFRKKPVAVVRADPETTSEHFGGGRAYHAAEAVRLGMADRVATLDEVLSGLSRRSRAPRAAAAAMAARARIGLI